MKSAHNNCSHSYYGSWLKSSNILLLFVKVDLTTFGMLIESLGGFGKKEPFEGG